MSSSIRFALFVFAVISASNAWSFDEWAVKEVLPRTRDLVRRHMIGAKIFLSEPKPDGIEPDVDAVGLPQTESGAKPVDGSTVKPEEPSVLKKIGVLTSSSSTVAPVDSKKSNKVEKKKEEVVAKTTTQAPTSAPTTKKMEKKTSEEELAGQIVDVAEVLRKIVEKEDKADKTIAEEKLAKKLKEKLPLIKETKQVEGVDVTKIRKVSKVTASPAPSASTDKTSVEVTTPTIANYRRVSCDMCLKALNGLNYNVAKLKTVAEDMVTKDCEALLYGDEEAIEACVEVMLRKIDEYYNRFEPMIQTNKVCVQLGMCAAQLVSTNKLPQIHS